MALVNVLEAVLNYTLPVDPAIQIARMLAVGWAGFQLVYVAVRWRAFSAPQAVSLALVAAITAFQETQQLEVNGGHGAPFLVWRLPLWYALLVACAWTLTRDRRGER